MRRPPAHDHAPHDHAPHDPAADDAAADDAATHDAASGGAVADAHPDRGAGPQPGCQTACAYLRQVDLEVTATKLRGAVDSTTHGCRAGATVTVWRTKEGADRRLVVLTSKETGAFRTDRPARAGRYYVSVTSPEQPLCAPVTSATVRVRRS